ncbi:MAG: hypothetical protein V4726_03755 [Verrucomicrobiota bacterium]
MINDWTVRFRARACGVFLLLLLLCVPGPVGAGTEPLAKAQDDLRNQAAPEAEEATGEKVADDGPGSPESRLIDESLEPPLSFSGDWAEPGPPPPPLPGAGPVPEPGFGSVATAARQPRGVLSGRVVYMNGGHGWIWDPDYWRTQRGITQEMNEDYGNLDQVNLFAAYCFNAGATVVSFRPLGQQTREVVLDNDDPEVTFTGSWANSTATVFFGSAGDVPYRYAALAAAETARATYTPNIPEAGFYPVYTWVRHGSDRGDQLYRIRHTGGESQVRVPHHMAGNGWVYLGEYYFNAGSSSAAGSVGISNQRGTAAGTYVFADAIRFGNGMGSVNRGSGLSTYPREHESSRYWVQAGLGQGQSSTLYNGGGDDESDSWGTPSKMSAEMNREEGGTANGRVHISFHSNAGGGRGVLGLITGDPTPNQAALAQLCGAEVNADLVALGSPPLEVPWNNRSNVTHTGGYSEIDGSLFNYEMAATIIEVAFHDSVEDSKLMRDPKARTAVARAAMHAAVKYFAQYDSLTAAYPPEPPTDARAQGGADGSVMLRWARPVSTGGAGAPTGYVIYRSADGLGFGHPEVVGNVTGHILTGLPAGTDTYFRIAAFNAAGESFPSETAGCRPPLSVTQPRALIVNAFDRNDRTLNPRQNITRLGYAPPGDTGTIERVLPRRSNSFSYVVPHGKAVAAAGWAFDSCQNEAAGVTVALADYAVVIWACGQESTADETFSAAEQARLAEFRQAGGALFVSGSEIGYDLGRAGGPAAADRAFLAGQLKVSLTADDSGSHTAVPVSGSAFSGRTSAVFDDGSRGIYPVRSPDVLAPAGSGARAALRYSGVAAGAAAVQDDGAAGGGRSMVFGFPFETITDPAVRAGWMTDSLGFLSAPAVLVPPGSVWKYNILTTDPGAFWPAAGFDDSAWPAGAAPLGYGGDGETTVLPAGNPPRVTTLFRRSFVVENPRLYRTLSLRLRRDDGAAVWLNGVEALRDNLPATGGPTFETRALEPVPAPAETAYVTHTLDARDLRAGMNMLAVEIHQADPDGADMGFDLELTAARDTGAPLIPRGSVWKYRDTGVTPPADWTGPGFDDTAWPAGFARLGYGGDGESTLLGFGPDPAAVYPVSWFRHAFQVADPAEFDGLRVELQRDDGAVLYLNGTELLRDNLPAGPLTGILAPAAAGGADETAWRSLLVPAAALRPGVNVLAAEVRQSSANSTDLGFDLRLSGLRQPVGAYDGWRAAAFGSSMDSTPVSGDNADPDGDGIVNLMEYALGLIPVRADAPPLFLAPDAPLTVSLTRSSLVTDCVLILESTSDLAAADWTPVARSSAGNPFESLQSGVTITESATGTVRTVSLIVPPASTGRLFLRISVIR